MESILSNKKYMNCYQEIIEILKNKNVVIIPNARLITKYKDSAINIYKELIKNNILKIKDTEKLIKL